MHRRNTFDKIDSSPGAPSAPATAESPFAPEPAEVLAALTLSRRCGVGAAAFKALLAAHHTPRRALEAFDAAAPGGPPRPKAALADGLSRARAFLEAGGFVTYVGAPGYPARLAELGEPPPVLFARGRAEVLGRPLVAVVGARDAPPGALAAAGAIASLCARAGVGVVSGGAAGVDAAAHEGALDGGGVTAVVLGCGVDVVSPRGHGPLFRRVAAGGALASELLPGAAPRASFFPTRNRLIAGLAGATLVACGRAESGALYTARWARRLGRPLLTLRCPPGDPLGEANRALAAAGATVLDGAEAFAAWLAARGARGPAW